MNAAAIPDNFSNAVQKLADQPAHPQRFLGAGLLQDWRFCSWVFLIIEITLTTIFPEIVGNIDTSLCDFVPEGKMVICLLKTDAIF